MSDLSILLYLEHAFHQLDQQWVISTKLLLVIVWEVGPAGYRPSNLAAWFHVSWVSVETDS